MSTLNNNNILFISPSFFGIEEKLIIEMKNLGNEVIWFDERSVNRSFEKAINKIFPYIFYNKSYRYIKEKIENINKKIDIIIVVKGDMLTKACIALLRSKWPNAKIVLYLWDPVSYIHGIKAKLKLYDKIFSFDTEDCNKYGFEFRPLFSDLTDRGVTNSNIQPSKYDICFFGTMYGDRFKIVYFFNRFCQSNNLRFYHFCYVNGNFMKIFYWLTNSFCRKLGVNKLNTIPKTKKEIEKILDDSKAVLDVNDNEQSGLTIRTLETVLRNKRLITTNTEIANYDFYNPNNILIIPRDGKIPDYCKFDNNFEKIDESILENYTAKGWVINVLSKI